jgi:hypothetical protein
MKAISLNPPYGTLIAAGLKRVETRSWHTTYRGPLAIHQTRNHGQRNEAALWDLCARPVFRSALARHGIRSVADLPRGRIVATCALIGIVSSQAIVGAGGHETTAPNGRRYEWVLDAEERVFGDYGPGRYCWLLADVQALAEPIAARGLQGLWEWAGEDAMSQNEGNAIR